MNKFEDVYDEVIYKLKKFENFHFSRYGDGEWAMILKNDRFNTLIKKWGNSFATFSEVLIKIVKSKPNYYFGIQGMAYDLWAKEIDEMIDGINCVNSDILHYRSLNNRISDFFEVLSKRKVVIVAPEYIKNISLISIYGHIVTPEYHVWDEIESIKVKIENFIKDNSNEKLVFLYSCSIVANILIDIFSCENITQIDTGSLLDPYVGVNSRQYHTTVIERLGIPESEVRIPRIK